MSSEAKHSPLPWRVDVNRQGQRRIVLEAGNHVLGACWGNYWNFPEGNTDETDKRAEADAVHIVECVNSHERLVEENARLKNIVRRMIPAVDCWRNTTNDCEEVRQCDVLMADARKALGEEDGHGA